MSAPTRPDEPPPPAFDQFHEWVEQWLARVISRRLLTGNREGTHTWCTQWWRHTEVCFRLKALHQGWEEARAKGGSAMSGWCVYHLDPHLRILLDAANGPMWRCAPERHTGEQTLPTEPVPTSWFDTDHDDQPRRPGATLVALVGPTATADKE